MQPRDQHRHIRQTTASPQTRPLPLGLSLASALTEGARPPSQQHDLSRESFVELIETPKGGVDSQASFGVVQHVRIDQLGLPRRHWQRHADRHRQRRVASAATQRVSIRNLFHFSCRDGSALSHSRAAVALNGPPLMVVETGGCAPMIAGCTAIEPARSGGSARRRHGQSQTHNVRVQTTTAAGAPARRAGGRNGWAHDEPPPAPEGRAVQ